MLLGAEIEIIKLTAKGLEDVWFSGLFYGIAQDVYFFTFKIKELIQL